MPVPGASRSAAGIAIGLLAASIGAVYTVFARWGIAQGLGAADLTVLRFGVAGVLTAPILHRAWRRDASALVRQRRAWAAVAVLAGTPFGLLMFGALRFAPASHGTVLPFAAMSVMGLVLGWAVLGERMGARKIAGIGVVVAGLLLLAGLDAASFRGETLLGDAMFLAAGTLWAGFGIVLRRHRLDPLLATAVISGSALVSYVPAYFALRGAGALLEVPAHVLWTEVLVQGVLAGGGTLLTYGMVVARLGAARAAVFPSLAPGLAALLAWPLLGFVPTPREACGIALAIAGLLVSVTGTADAPRPRAPRRWSPRARLVALGLVGSALTCTAGTVAVAVLEGGGPVDGATVLRRLLFAYSGAALVVLLLFPWVMPRLAAWLERNGWKED